MEIYLRVEHGGDVRRGATGGGRSAAATDVAADLVADVVVRVEPSHSVGDVADAVVAYLRRSGQGFRGNGGCRVSRVEPGRAGVTPLDPLLTVSEAGILSGQTLLLGAVRARPDQLGGAQTLVVASGPDVGAQLDLAPGAYLIGRADDCDLSLTDPQISRRHLRLTVDTEDRVTVEVLATDRNQVRIGGLPLEERRQIEPGEVLRLGASSLVIRMRPTVRSTPVDTFGQVPFHRTPYFPAPVQRVVIEPIKDIPARPEKSRFAYLSALLPLLMGVSLAVILGRPQYLLFAAFSPVMVIGNYFEQRRRSGKKFEASVERFDKTLAVKAVEVREAMAAERARRFAATPDLAGLQDRAVSRAVDLWVRDRQAYDFLNLRVGVGDLPTALEVEYSDVGDVDYRERIVDAYGQTSTMTDVPVTLDLATLGVVGLIGAAGETTALASSLTLQAACLHSPEDLVIAAATAPGRGLADWLKWTPHARSSSSPLGVAHLVETKGRADQLIVELINEAARRLAISKGVGGASGSAGFPWLLVVLDRALEPDAAVVSRLLDACPDAGISVVWLTDSRERVPRQAQAVIECQPPMSGTMSRISFTDPVADDRLVDLDRATPHLATETGMALAPLRDASSANAATAIPRIVPLFTALGIEAVDRSWVADQWETDRGYSLQGPIGYTDSGPLVLDIVEHGPHGLIGGTSGAGKSELVMSMVAGLIAYNPPTRINFLFIDYKGGASSDLFKDVPHTVGYVTNLDGILSMRALTSLQAELNRRMSLMQGKAKDLAEMIERFPDEAPPSLVIVVDEFATLVKEIPDFVAGIVDIAQRGRSLGIHLMLATQRPSGSVNDNIKANTNLRISLRMLDGGESTAVIGVPDAAAIPAPLKGRGFAMMGPGELVAFQSAWAGAPLLAESGTPPVGVEPFGRADLSTLLSTGSPVSSDQKSNGSEAIGRTRTQIDALLDAVIQAADRLGYHKGRPPWLEVLPDVVAIEAARDESDHTLEPGSNIVIGMIDDPGAQRQYPAVLNLARSGGLIVAGTGGSGKSTLLRTAAVSAAMDDSALGGGHLTIFALDFASRALGALNRLPQCGGVAGGDDLEAVTRIIALMHGEFERRRQALADSVAKAEAAPNESAVLLLIDGMEAATYAMEQGPGAGLLSDSYAQLTKLITDGRQVGMYPIIATARRSSIRAAVSSAISDRITLHQSDLQGFTDAGISSTDAKGMQLRPGQGFLNGPTLLQVALITDPALTGSETEEVMERAERERFAEIAGSLVGAVDPRLVTKPLPTSVAMLQADAPLLPAIGLKNMTCDRFVLDLTYNNVSIMGDPRTGRSTALATIGRSAARAGAEVWVLAGPGSPLRALNEASQACFAEGRERTEFVERLVSLTDESATPRILLIDDHDFLPENDRDFIASLEKLLTTVRFAAAGSIPRGFSSSPLLQHIKGCRSAIYLKPHDGREAHEVLGVPVPWHPGLPIVEGRGFVVVDRVPTMVQISNAFHLAQQS